MDITHLPLELYRKIKKMVIIEESPIFNRSDVEIFDILMRYNSLSEVEKEYIFQVVEPFRFRSFLRSFSVELRSDDTINALYRCKSENVLEIFRCIRLPTPRLKEIAAYRCSPHDIFRLVSYFYQPSQNLIDIAFKRCHTKDLISLYLLYPDFQTISSWITFVARVNVNELKNALDSHKINIELFEKFPIAENFAEIYNTSPQITFSNYETIIKRDNIKKKNGRAVQPNQVARCQISFAQFTHDYIKSKAGRLYGPPIAMPIAYRFVSDTDFNRNLFVAMCEPDDLVDFKHLSDRNFHDAILRANEADIPKFFPRKASEADLLVAAMRCDPDKLFDFLQANRIGINLWKIIIVRCSIENIRKIYNDFGFVNDDIRRIAMNRILRRI